MALWPAFVSETLSVVNIFQSPFQQFQQIHGGGSTSKINNNDHHNEDDHEQVQTAQNAFVSDSSSNISCSDDMAIWTFPEIMQTKAKVDDIITAGGTIKNIFKPLKYLGRGIYSATYKGII